MDPRTRLAKTDKGREEIESRRHKLPAKLRTLLILIDGTHTFDQVSGDAAKLGAPEDALALLIEHGFVAPVGASGTTTIQPAGVPEARDDAEASPATEFERFRTAQQFMNETAVDNMGAFKKFTFTLKLERCAVREDLAALVGDYEQSLAKSIGSEGAAVLTNQLRALLR